MEDRLSLEYDTATSHYSFPLGGVRARLIQLRYSFSL